MKKPLKQLHQSSEAPPLAVQKKLRVLCLHGTRTNAIVMINQTKGLRAALGDQADFVFVNAPLLASGPTDPIIEQHHAQDKPFYEWWYCTVTDGLNKPTWNWILHHHEDTLEFLHRELTKHGPFDIFLGFSQGAAVATVLAMLYLQKHTRRLCKLCVCVGGVHIRGIQLRHLFETPGGRSLKVPIPSIHVIGRSDPLFEHSLSLANLYDDHCAAFPQSPFRKLVMFHDGGHKFPSPNKHQDLYAALAQTITEHCRACGQEDKATTKARL